MPLRALLFDMNGVIVDDMAYHERAWIELAARHGRTLGSAEFREVMAGRRNRDNVAYIFGEGLSAAEILARQEEKERAYRDAYGPHRAALPGLVALLDEARARGVRTAVATSAPPANIDFVLDFLDLRRRFDAVVGEADVRRAKPDPEIYRVAAERLGVAPRDCVVFEDSLAGVASGVAAGMVVVGLSTTHSAEELRGCVAVVRDFTALTVDSLRDAVDDAAQHANERSK